MVEPPSSNPLFAYSVIDRRCGKQFASSSIRAANRTEARKEILREAKRDQPRDARNNGYVPLRDWQIVFQVPR